VDLEDDERVRRDLERDLIAELRGWNAGRPGEELGNQVELQVDAFDKAGAAGYFHTEPFAKNPIGVLFDADKMLADYEAGVPEADLLRRP